MRPSSEAQAERGGAIVARVRGVRRVFPASAGSPARAALDGVSLEIREGSWVALLGPNGSGKSTLMKLLATQDTPDEGTVELFGVDTARSPTEARARLGVVFQRPGLDALLTVRENLHLQAALSGMSRAEARSRAEQTSHQVGISERLDDRVGTLSGGLARRADLARALVPQPSLLLLDEPSTGLDPAWREGFLALLADLRSQQHGLTIVMSTHLLDEAERADEVVLLCDGRVAAAGRPADLTRGLVDEASERSGSCAALGAVLTAPAASAGTLSACGLRIREVGASVLGSGDSLSLGSAATKLIAQGVVFEIGPPTLREVYFAATGTRLAEVAEAPHADPAPTTRSRRTAVGR